MKLSIVIYPDPALSVQCVSVETIDNDLLSVIDEMHRVMCENRGVGLAANQIGICKRLFVMHVDDISTTCINPVVLSVSNECTVALESNEGCLSFPGIQVQVARPKSVNMSWLGSDNKIYTRQFTGLSAKCVLHEIDHLNGITMLDHVSRQQRRSALRTLGIL